jgi:uncharacterized membrane protein
MRSPVDSLMQTILISGLIALAMLLVWIWGGGSSGGEILAFLFRFTHVFAAMVWVGLIWFVNVVQLSALSTADEADRIAIMRSIVPRTAAMMRHTSHLTLLSGAALLVTSGYMFGGLAFAAEVYTSPLRGLFIWGGVLAAVAMWVFLNMLIWPAMKVASGQTNADPQARALARDRVRTYARLNLLLSLPVTFVMIGAGHL